LLRREPPARWWHSIRPNGTRRAAIPPTPADDIRRLEIPVEAAGSRLDRALADLLPEHSRTQLKAWIQEARVTVNGAPRAPRDRVEGGEQVEIRIPPPRQSELLPEDIPLDLAYEDEYLVVVDKPHGLTVHPGSGQPDGTLANALVHHFQGLPELGGSDRPGIVHRLDKDTSGLLLVAKTEAVQRALSAAFAERRVEKTYRAVVHGAVAEESGIIEAPIGRSPRHRTLMAVTTPARGRTAKTRYAVERRLPRHTLVRLHPHTGRTHQLRVHMQHLGHTIVGDPYYGNPSAPGEAEAGRLLLHAARLAIAHPVTGEALVFEAPLPPAFLEAIARLALLEPPRRGRR
jgi:23S rRNA pseudouridine1911/1915/1917 synthase